MAPLILGFVVGTVIFWAVWLWQRKPKGRMVDCAACHKPLPAAKAVIIHGQITRDRDAYATTVAEFHKGCAPTGQPRSLP